jgi:muconate cycloisomerase
MRLRRIRIDALRIPFVARFAHGAADRSASDSIIVRLESDAGEKGYGEAIARPYVTGETAASCFGYLATVLWPALRGVRLPGIGNGMLESVAGLLPPIPDGVVIPNGAHAAMEAALLDLMLRSDGRGLGELLPPRSPTLTYSGVIGFGSASDNAAIAGRLARAGFRAIKVKVGRGDDADRIAAIRDAVGPDVSLRLDANGAFSAAEAARRITRLARYGVAAVEQPLPRGEFNALARLQQELEVPLMADESLLTPEDARRLIDAGACRFFNLRIAKLGGVIPTLAIAALARDAGIRLQLGCQVGETSLLSATGRHVAAHLPGIEFVEGSYGRHLLEEDITRTPVEFGAGGLAPVLGGAGNGVQVDDGRIRKYSIESMNDEVHHERTT